MHIHDLVKETLSLRKCPVTPGTKARVNIVVLGDVSTTMLTGLKLLGSDVIESIGICDIRKENTARLEMEMNQIGYPFEGTRASVRGGGAGRRALAGDVLIFCASRGIPPAEPGSNVDVRMAQLELTTGISSGITPDWHEMPGIRGWYAWSAIQWTTCARRSWMNPGWSHGRFRDTVLESCTKERNTTLSKDSRFASYLTEGRAFILTGKTW